VRGVLATGHVFLKDRSLTERDLWIVYRRAYGDEPFVRIVKERQGVYRYPEPKILAGSNYCDVGFELDEHTGRVVTLAAIDNLVKGAAGSAVQSMNLMLGLPETAGLTFPGLHPI
jgi:N-acetyl-gamma-glutamyl-phosphate/LysW-gamma-L-alpha-aminoadipyl-6-phosphate reductase